MIYPVQNFDMVLKPMLSSQSQWGLYSLSKTNNDLMLIFDVEILTRRERLKSGLYLRLKKRKTFFWRKNLKFLNFFLSKNVA